MFESDTAVAVPVNGEPSVNAPVADNLADIADSAGGADGARPQRETTDSGSAADHRRARYRPTLVVGLAIMLTLGSLAGSLGWQMRAVHHKAERDAAFVQAARQGALNLTTIDWRNAESNVQRILDSATGAFYEDFSKRSGPFIEAVKQAQSTSEGTVVAAGMQSETGDEAEVLVAVNVDVSNVGAAEQRPRSWRIRMTVRDVGKDVKVTNVEFVP